MPNNARAIPCAVLSALALAVHVGAQPSHAPPQRTEVAPGIHLFQTPVYGDVGLDGNSVAIVTAGGVLVFDTNGTPAAAAAVLAEIRKLTDQPVRFVVNSHWHWDHWYGTEIYRQAFPDVSVIAHQATRRMMAGAALEFNRPGIEVQLPAYIRSLEARIAAGPPSPEIDRLKRLVEADRFFLEQKAKVQHVFPDLTIGDSLDIRLGGRYLRVVHPGRAVTPGDVFLYLPEEKILITGDLLVNPISFALSSYPTEWLRALEMLDGLDASLIVPGHGEPLRDEVLLHATRDVFRELLRQGKELKARGMTADQAKAQILPTLAALETTITGGDARRSDAFRVQLVDWYLHRVFDELDGPLGNEIGAFPPE